jgi:hypothetical protein
MRPRLALIFVLICAPIPMLTAALWVEIVPSIGCVEARRLRRDAAGGLLFPGAGFRVEVFFAAYGVGRRVTLHP